MKKLTRTMEVRFLNAKLYDKVTDEIMDEKIMIPRNEKPEDYVPENIVILSFKEEHDLTIRVSIPMDEFINFVIDNKYYEVV